VILVDSSIWIEYLRATGRPPHRRLAELVAGDAALATTDVVAMELLAGARDDLHERRLRGLLARCELLTTRAPADYEDAARVYRLCRQAGATPRKLTDCLIAAVAIRHDAELLHADADFGRIAAHTQLRVAGVS
jgi:predicted nucleic acid-binding protein